MILYHGSNVEIEAIDFSKSKPGKDFGVGFIPKKIMRQAEKTFMTEELVKELALRFPNKSPFLLPT